MGKAEKTKQYIIEKAATLFNKKGIAGTSMNDIGDLTGLTKGALYGNFKNKDEIAVAAYDFNIRHIRSSFFSPPDRSTSSIDQLLKIPEFYEDHFPEIAKNGGCPIANTSTEADDSHPLLKKKVGQSIRTWKKNIETIISIGIERGEIRKTVQPQHYSGLILALLEGGLLLSKTTEDMSFIRTANEQIRDLIQKEIAL